MEPGKPGTFAGGEHAAPASMVGQGTPPAFARLNGRFPGSRIIASRRLPRLRLPVSQWRIGVRLPADSCGGSCGFERRPWKKAPHHIPFYPSKRGTVTHPTLDRTAAVSIRPGLGGDLMLDRDPDQIGGSGKTKLVLHLGAIVRNRLIAETDRPGDLLQAVALAEEP